MIPLAHDVQFPNVKGVESTLEREDESDNRAYEDTDQTNDGDATKGGDWGEDLEANEDSGGTAGPTRDVQPRRNTGLGGKYQLKHPVGVEGAVLNLSNVGLDDETLEQVKQQPATHPFGSHGNNARTKNPRTKNA